MYQRTGRIIKHPFIAYRFFIKFSVGHTPHTVPTCWGTPPKAHPLLVS